MDADKLARALYEDERRRADPGLAEWENLHPTTTRLIRNKADRIIRLMETMK